MVDTEPDLQMAEVIPGAIFLGSQDVAADVELLRSRGITHVLNMAPSAVDNFYPAEGQFIYDVRRIFTFSPLKIMQLIYAIVSFGS